MKSNALDQDFNKVMRQFLLLPILLGLLLVVNGVIGIVAARRASEQLRNLDYLSSGPSLAFERITENLNFLSVDLLRLNQPGIQFEVKQKLLQDSQELTRKISKQIKLQLELPRNPVYGDYLTQWEGDWKAFELKIISQTNASLVQGRLDLGLNAQSGVANSLASRMGNVRSFVETEIKSGVEQSAKATRSATIKLILTLGLGMLVALLCSVVIVRGIRSLFVIISTGKKTMETLLNNLGEGFLVFDSEGKVLPGVSTAAKDFLENDPTGLAIADALPFDRKAQEQIKNWFSLAYEGKFRFEDLKPLAPRSFESKGRYIELDFRPIYFENTEKLEKIICISSDKTQEKRLRDQFQNEAALVKLIMAVLSDRASFVDFVLEARKILIDVMSELNKASPKVDPIFRGIHSLNGGSACFHFVKMRQEARDIECTLTSIRTHKLEIPKQIQTEIWDKVVSMSEQFETFLYEYEYILGKVDGAQSRTKTVTSTAIEEMYQLIFNNVGKQNPIYTEFVCRFVQEDIGTYFKRFETPVRTLAEKQLKKIDLDIEHRKAMIYPPPYSSLLTSFIHVFRNAVDHGIEDEVTRAEIGKRETGTISVAFETFTDASDVSRLRIVVADDGKGVDTGLVLKKAVERGLISTEESTRLSNSEILQLLFHPRFSTLEKVSEISGRGVGLDAVKQEAIAMGGAARIESERGVGTSVIIEVPLLLSPVIVNIESIQQRENRKAG